MDSNLSDVLGAFGPRWVRKAKVLRTAAIDLGRALRPAAIKVVTAIKEELESGEKSKPSDD